MTVLVASRHHQASPLPSGRKDRVLLPALPNSLALTIPPRNRHLFSAASSRAATCVFATTTSTSHRNQPPKATTTRPTKEATDHAHHCSMNFVAPSAPRKRPLEPTPSSSNSSDGPPPSSSGPAPSKIPKPRVLSSSAYPALRFTYGSPARPPAGSAAQKNSTSTPANATAPPGRLRQSFFDVLDVQRKSPKKAPAKMRRCDFDDHELNTPPAALWRPTIGSTSSSATAAVTGHHHDVLMHDSTGLPVTRERRASAGSDWSATDHAMPAFHSDYGHAEPPLQPPPEFVRPGVGTAVNSDVIMKLVGSAAAHDHQFDRGFGSRPDDEREQQHHRRPQPQPQAHYRATGPRHSPYRQHLQPLLSAPVDQKETNTTPSASTRVAKPVPKRIFTPRLPSPAAPAVEYAFPTVSLARERVGSFVRGSWRWKDGADPNRFCWLLVVLWCGCVDGSAECRERTGGPKRQLRL